uniref:C-type lectin domain-containing protein n=1 Tax=Sinocyclocheilus anshuiensis TaxID=1608454 RepID=A0A671R812_9TELE
VTLPKTSRPSIGLITHLIRVWSLKLLMPGLDFTQNRVSGSGQEVKIQHKVCGIQDTSYNQIDKVDGCAFLHKVRKKLHDIECTAKYSYFCMTNFVLVLQKETWEGALEYCRKHYNDLASLSTKERMNSALMEISQAETEYVWTGLRFLAWDWLWVNRDDLKYTAWYQNEQPQCPARELRCEALDKETKLWTHRNCEEKLSFVCQQKVQ